MPATYAIGRHKSVIGRKRIESRSAIEVIIHISMDIMLCHIHELLSFFTFQIRQQRVGHRH